jgi:peptide-methionine (S)-S-oxide reductase
MNSIKNGIIVVSMLAVIALAILVAGMNMGPLKGRGVSAAEAETNSPAGSATAIFAMGCFWCAEDAFEGFPGVISVVSGYTGGKEINPTYEQVSAHRTGHYEAIKIVYDPTKISFDKLLYVFWRNVDPLTPEAQFCDRGHQYGAAIFATDSEQRRLAEASKTELSKSGRFKSAIVSEIVDASDFYTAEDYHQDYAKNNPLRYSLYRYNCGRDARLDAVWGAEARGGAKAH